MKKCRKTSRHLFLSHIDTSIVPSVVFSGINPLSANPSKWSNTLKQALKGINQVFYCDVLNESLIILPSVFCYFLVLKILHLFSVWFLQLSLKHEVNLYKSILSFSFQFLRHTPMLSSCKNTVNLFKYNVEKWPNMLYKSCGVNTTRFLKYVWSFSNMHERINKNIQGQVFQNLT